MRKKQPGTGSLGPRMGGRRPEQRQQDWSSGPWPGAGETSTASPTRLQTRCVGGEGTKGGYGGEDNLHCRTFVMGQVLC